jgi:hypothetical protein
MEVQISNCPHTGKIRKVISSLIIRERNGHLRTSRVIDYFEEDGTTRSESVTEGISKVIFATKEQLGTTEGSYINPLTNEFTTEDDPNGVPEIDVYRDMSLATLPPEVTTVGQLLDYLELISIQLADANGRF